MTIEILMPALSPTMTEGTLAKWHKGEGEEVAPGDIIAEIETDKATMEVEAVDGGTLSKILVPEGTAEVQVNQVIAVLLEDGEDTSVLDAAVANAAKAKDDRAPAEAVKPETQAATTASPARAEPTQPSSAQKPSGDKRMFASPLARRLAAKAGLNLSLIRGSGPHGRIVKADIDAAVTAPAPAGALAPTVDADFELVPHTAMRKAIARRLTESKQTVPHFYLTVDCQIDQLLETRKELNSRSDAYKISVNDMIIKMCAQALIEVPAANAAWSEEGARYFKSADIAVAVAVPGGLITPIIRGAQGKGLRTISDEMKELVGRAREGKLKPEEYEGGTFSVSNLGMFGIREFAAVINPPQACILAVGAGEKRPVVTDGALGIATVMTCTLSVDHRVVDGAVGAEFLAALRSLIESPLSLML
jgi:pyruvate dehydrogenase E2 component (dihydrolipoamide acetyltransferase)